MELLPLILQAALLLLGCALSRYLWEINLIVASVVLGATSSGIIFYIFIVVAGAASENCPYQTPGARILRRILRPTLRSVTSGFPVFLSSKFSSFTRKSWCYRLPFRWWLSMERPWYSMGNFINSLLITIVVPIAPIIDAYLLGRALLRSLVAPGRAVYCSLIGTSPPQTHGLDGLDQRTIRLDLRCISWMLRMPLDRPVHFSVLKHLAETTVLTDFDPTLVADCFDAFVGCVNISNRKVEIIQGMEELATVSALCFFRTISHLLTMDSESNVFKDTRQRYVRIFPARANFHGHRFHYTMNAVHCLFVRSRRRRGFEWSDYIPSAYEHTIVACALAQLAQFKYRGTQPRKVSRWILRFALHSLSLDPPPAASVVADCLSIIAIDLGCGDASNSGTTATDKRCAYIYHKKIALTPN
jgi:hypothetical protein